MGKPHLGCILETIFTVVFLVGIAVLGIVIDLGLIAGNQRGFFCGDPSLGYPYDASTFPDWLLVILYYAVPSLMFIIIDLGVRRRPWLYYYTFVYFNYDCFGCYTTTNILKLTVGRPRPNFIAVCAPNILINRTCESLGGKDVYLTDFKCTNPHGLSHRDIMNTFWSFPSGHGSGFGSSSVFIVVYAWWSLHYTDSNKVLRVWAALLRLFILFLVFVVSAFGSASRVMNYKHNASDVVAGLTLGIFFGVVSSIAWWQTATAISHVKPGSVKPEPREIASKRRTVDDTEASSQLLSSEENN